MNQFNLLVSHRFKEQQEAHDEIVELLNKLGDTQPQVVDTSVKGIIGVKTSLDARNVTAQLRSLFRENHDNIKFAIKWVPVDNWCDSNIDIMVETVKKVKDQIGPDETWAMDIEKRKYPNFRTYDILTRLAENIKSRVDLKKPQKILRVDIMGPEAGISVLKPEDIFSVSRG
ncbi:MAG TPA: THUMP domain-containing protein [Chitinispirillaceae bacterium]|jgi:tRNA(Ser,Leu) C12 N-acetylase TAN1|nr:THUMP domain-containing protein [Chitinispirillaceae bacterium]